MTDVTAQPGPTATDDLSWDTRVPDGHAAEVDAMRTWGTTREVRAMCALAARPAPPGYGVRIKVTTSDRPVAA